MRLAESISTDATDNPTDSEIKETVCYGRNLDKYVVAQHKIYSTTHQYGDRLPQMYFGAHNGVFRIFPARHSSSCRTYDNRKRPWYVAASSGPKDIIIILDISGSMSRQDRISLAKQAAIDVISALTIGDHFGVVLFSDDA